MAVDLQAIHRALAAQIRAGVERDTNVYPFPQSDPTFPCITVYPNSDVYINYAMTMDDEADLMLRLRLDVDGDAESIAIKICDYLSTGTGNGSSIVDALHADPTLDGLVENCLILHAEWPDPDSDPGAAWLPVLIYLNRE